MSGNPNAQKSPLSAFGRKILRWDIEAPTEDQAQAALDLARHEGQFNAVQQLVQRIQRQQRPPELDMPFQAPDLSVGLVSTEVPKASVPALKNKINAFQQHGARPFAPYRKHSCVCATPPTGCATTVSWHWASPLR
jgi:hypothetical protein